MANTLLFTTQTLKSTVYLFLLLITLKCATSARLLDEVDPQLPAIANTPISANPTTFSSPTTIMPSGQFPALAPTDDLDDDADPPVPEISTPTVVEAPIDDVATHHDDLTPVATPVTSPVVGPVSIPGPTTISPTGPASVATTITTMTQPDQHDPSLSLFMHDIIGGSHPSARVVTGIIANSDINGLPFSKPNNNIFPINGGTPLINGGNINNLINNNNLPLLTGLNGAQTNTIIQNTGNNNIVNGNNNQPFVTAGQLPAGSSIQQLMFGTITVIDDELTEGHELGSAVLGKAQGFYLASSLDGTSQTIALTVLLHGAEHEHEDTISFFGVHRTASPESQIAVVGGTGKYENANGYATLETLHQENQHTTDGVDTILHFNVYLSDH